MKTIHKISLLAAAAVMAIALSSFIHIGDPMKMYEKAKQEQMRTQGVCENCESPDGYCVCEGDVVVIKCPPRGIDHGRCHKNCVYTGITTDCCCIC